MYYVNITDKVSDSKTKGDILVLGSDLITRLELFYVSSQFRLVKIYAKMYS